MALSPLGLDMMPNLKVKNIVNESLKGKLFGRIVANSAGVAFKQGITYNLTDLLLKLPMSISKIC